jgi:hypothetical protein
MLLTHADELLSLQLAHSMVTIIFLNFYVYI